MGIFELQGPDGSTYEVDAPSPERAIAAFKKMSPPAPQGFMANTADFVKSIPRGLITGLTSASNPSMVPTEDEQMAVAPIRQAATETLKAPTYAPQGPAGRVGEAIGEGLGNPVSYIGPGGLALKVGGAVLSSAGSEGARQATEGTTFEKPAAIAGAVAGGVLAGKTLGPGAPKAVVPTSKELFQVGGEGYKRARNSGLEVKPDAVSSWATKVEQELSGADYGFTGGSQGVAPKTFRVLGTLQAVPKGAVVTASNLDALRKNLGRIAQETQPAGPGGFAKPTPDAAAASIVLKRLGDFSENLPQGSILAGNAADYVRATKQANANWGAGERTRDFDARLTKAENATDRQVAGSLDSQIKIKAGQLLDNPSKVKGLTPQELAQLQLINSGSKFSNLLRQAGRGGAGVIPIMAQLTAAAPLAAATGGASIIPQAVLAAGLYGARKGSEAMTKSRAKELAEMLAKRSPEYERRAANLPPADNTQQQAAILRALLNTQ